MWNGKHLWSCFPWVLSLTLAAAVVWQGINLREARGELARMKQQELDSMRMRGRIQESQQQYWVRAIGGLRQREQEARRRLEQAPPPDKGHSELVQGADPEASPEQPGRQRKDPR